MTFISHRLTACLALWFTAAAGLAHATSVCDLAAAEAAPRHGVPLDVMRAITRVETGHRRAGRFTPWPWTTNVAGQGAWHDNRADAYQAIQAAQARGHDSIDIGCFQINLRWHGQAFEGIGDMLDPDRNADYAARFLAELYREFGTWQDAVGAFHSRTERFAARYRAKYREVYAALDPMDDLAEPNPARDTAPGLAATTRDNRYPLLQNPQSNGQDRLPGSLVPAGIGTSPLFN